MSAFPSVDWLDRVREEFNGNDRYHGAGGGACDAVVGLKIGERAFRIVFEGVACVDASEIGDAGLDEVDFYLEMEHEDWSDMIRNIQRNGHADLDHTLNTLDLSRDDGLAKTRTGDQFKQDMFFRFNQTLQFFFDASSCVATEFPS